MRVVRVSIGKLLAATLLTLCVGVQALEASGRWDRTLQDSGDEAVIVTVVLCVGAALLTARAMRPQLVPTIAALKTVAVFVAALPLSPCPIAQSTFNASPPLSLRI
jgi:hypothetical protein